MEVCFWGVRGSIPSPGPETARYGGNSSCVEVRLDNGEMFVLDCGTGARKLGMHLARSGVREAHLLFSHFHMDHVFGFPFFLPLYTPGFKLDVRVPARGRREAKAVIDRYLDGVYHPVRLDDVPAAVTFKAVLPEQAFDAGAARVTPIPLHHPGSATGYRIDHDGQSMAYITDTSPFAKPGVGVEAGELPTKAEQRLIRALAGCDFVVFDTMFSRAEYLEKMTWGHSYPEYAAAICKAADVECLALFHHLPDATDGDLDALAASWANAENPRVIVATEGSRHQTDVE